MTRIKQIHLHTTKDSKPFSWKWALVILILFIICVMWGLLVRHYKVGKLDTMGTLVVPTAAIVVKDAGEAKDRVSPAPVINQDTLSPIERYIWDTFGDSAPKALLVLKGNGVNCLGENKTLNTFAVNDNTLWGGVGRDRGIFQISDYFHPGVSDACAFNFKCNIDYAYRMYVNDNYTFVRWTQGKCLNI